MGLVFMINKYIIVHEVLLLLLAWDPSDILQKKFQNRFKHMTNGDE